MKPARDMTEEELKQAIMAAMARQRGKHVASDAKAKLIELIDEENRRGK